MPDKSKLAIDTVPLPENVVRVMVPYQVAFQLESINKVKVSILERLGCPRCHSGWDIRFDIARFFAVDDKLNIREGMPGIVITDG
jgi:hypothetical protein